MFNRSIAKLFVVAMVCAVVAPAECQESLAFKLHEHTFNAGGHPQQGSQISSAGFRMSLDCVGDAMVATSLAGSSYRIDGGFAPAYQPPGEVVGLSFADVGSITWGAERSAGSYRVYRSQVTTPFDLDYGTCLATDVASTSLAVPEDPMVGQSYSYLATAVNRLSEEGTKGSDHAGQERSNTNPCP